MCTVFVAACLGSMFGDSLLLLVTACRSRPSLGVIKCYRSIYRRSLNFLSPTVLMIAQMNAQMFTFVIRKILFLESPETYFGDMEITGGEVDQATIGTICHSPSCNK